MASQSRAWALPGEPAVVRLMNTIWADTAGIHDDLGSAAALHDWIAAVTDRTRVKLGVPSSDDLADALRLRDALRRLAAFCTQDPRENASGPIETAEEAVDAVNAVAARRAPDQLTLRDAHLERHQADIGTEVSSTLADLAQQAIDLLTGPSATKLRACPAPNCVLYFVQSHPRREWCSDACGNRARAARHYQRVRSRKR